MFRESKFEISKTIWILILKSGELEGVNNMLESCANNIRRDSLSIILSKLFIYNRNSRGSNMEPCGTQPLILDHFESVMLLYFLLFNDIFLCL